MEHDHIMTKYYCGIGSRQTPKNILAQMTELAKLLSNEYILRSGHADGADQAFEAGAELAEIWLPWKSFNAHIKNPLHIYRTINSSDKEAYDSLKFHPAGNNLKESICALMARNYRQVIGRDSPNSKFVICWTSDGGPTGGTGQALRIAAHHNIPIYNLYFKDTYGRIITEHL